MNSIIWRGVDSTTIKGLLISELPPISKPPLRIKETTIDGMDGSIIEELGYAPYDKTVVVGLRNGFNIDEIIKYFTGTGEIVFSNEPTKVYTAKIIGQIDYNRLLKYRQASVVFRVQPYKLKLNEAYKETQTATATGATIHFDDIFKITSLDVESETGTIKTVGKNLFDYKTRLTKSYSGITNVLNDDGSITTSGVLSANHAYITSYDLDEVLINGRSYTMSQKFPSEKVYMQLNIKNKTTQNISYVHLAYDKKRTFVANTENNTYTLLVQTASTSDYGSEYAEITNYYQLEEGAVATDFEPYVSSRYEYTTNENLAEHITVFSPKTTLFNSNVANMTVEYIKPYEVFNEGFENSKPLMVLKGSGTVEISLNGAAIFTYTFPDGEDTVCIDSQTEDAYLGSELKNRNMNGEFPVLVSGTNIIEWSGTVKSIDVLPRSRWL